MKSKSKIDEDLKQASFVELKNIKSKLYNREMSSFNNFLPHPISPEYNSEPKFNNFLAEMNLKVQLQIKKSNQSFNTRKNGKNSILKDNMEFKTSWRIKSYFCKPKSSQERRKHKTFKFLEKYFNERLDLIYYFRILNHIDRIKNIIFNSYQKNCFNLLSKPNIFKNEELNMFGIQKKINHDRMQKEVVDYYKKIVKNDSIDYYDKKILIMLPENIKFKIFQEEKTI